MLSVLLFAATLGDFSVVDSAAHNSRNYTQGLFFDGVTLYESTGQYGDSRLLRYPSVGNVETDSLKLEPHFFGEGSVKLGNDIFWLTWRENRAFVCDAKTFQIKSSFAIPGEGWGLTLYNGALLLSDGTSNLFFVSPGDKNVFKTLPVTDGDRRVDRLNELEMVGNYLYANVWQSDSIAVIDVNSGKVLKWLDFSEIAERVRMANHKAEVLNGIAYDGKFLWVTGKYWPVIYKVKLNEIKNKD